MLFNLKKRSLNYANDKLQILVYTIHVLIQQKCWLTMIVYTYFLYVAGMGIRQFAIQYICTVDCTKMYSSTEQYSSAGIATLVLIL